MLVIHRSGRCKADIYIGILKNIYIYPFHNATLHWFEVGQAWSTGNPVSPNRLLLRLQESKIKLN
jgi:hypothetical protein